MIPLRELQPGGVAKHKPSSETSAGNLQEMTRNSLQPLPSLHNMHGGAGQIGVDESDVRSACMAPDKELET